MIISQKLSAWKSCNEYLNPQIKSVVIGEFTGDSGKDIDKMLAILEEDYGITESPEGYIVHHDIENGILQLVDENIHTEFTHIGGEFGICSPVPRGL